MFEVMTWIYLSDKEIVADSHKTLWSLVAMVKQGFAIYEDIKSDV